jgi:Skp family chaperone for outer membrane proteins
VNIRYRGKGKKARKEGETKSGRIKRGRKNDSSLKRTGRNKQRKGSKRKNKKTYRSKRRGRTRIKNDKHIRKMKPYVRREQSRGCAEAEHAYKLDLNPRSMFHVKKKTKCT